MENQVQKNDSQEKGLIRNLQVALTKTGISSKLVDKYAVNLELRKFKDDNGRPNYPALFNIPVSERLPAMAKKDIGGTIKIVTVAITLAMEAFNVARPMTNSQIVDLAEVVVDSLNQGDNLSLEDFMLYLQKLTRGEYPELYEGIDQIKFMARFDKYRDERWEESRRLYYEKHEQYKEMGDKRRVRESTDNPLDVHLSSMTSKVEQLKDELREQKNLNKRLREDF